MTETTERTILGEAILKHWREHCPQMVRDLEQQNRLDQAVFETQERTGDLLYDLVSVKKMDYHAAWELAREEWALPQEENKGGNLPPTVNPSSGTSRPRRPKPEKPGSANSKSATSSRKWPRGRRRGTSG